VSRPLRAALGLADQIVQDAVLARVAPHVPLVHALVERRVLVAARIRVVLQRVVRVRLHALACCPRLRLLALQRSAPAQHPCRERPWSLAQ
jgi:hypothetical protein